MRKLVCALLLLLAATATRADELRMGESAPSLEIETWLTVTEAESLEGLRGRVVVLLLGGACDLADDNAVLRWNDLRAAYFSKGLRVIVVVPKAPDDVSEAIEFSVAAGPATAYGATDAPRVVLIAADGKAVWEGEPAALSDELVAKLLKKAKAFHVGKVDPLAKPVALAFKKGRLATARELAGTIDHEDAKRVAARATALLTYWQKQVERSKAANNPAETAVYLAWIAKHLKDTTEGTEAGVQLKALKSDKQVAKEIKAAAAYTRLRGDWIKTKGKRKKIDALVKKAEGFEKKYKDTCGAQRAARLAARIKADPAVTALQTFIRKEKIDTDGSGWRTRLPKPPEVEFDDGRSYYWHLDTSEGALKLRFFPDSAPMHVSSMIYLTELGFFDGLTFHRVMPGFMAQGGCPNGTGSGNPGYMFDGELDPDRGHDRAGLLSAANRGPNTDSCQFFITFAAATHLDGKHTVYGETVSGQKTLKKLEDLATVEGTPKKRIVIKKATVSVE